MEPLWPWLAVAAAGALHGVNPVTGWALAAWRAEGAMQVLRALVPIGIGHLASVLVVAAAVPVALRFGVAVDPLVPQGVAAGLLLVLVVRHFRSGHGHGCRAPARHAGFALWSFVIGTAHGTGWLLVPALVPLCGGELPGREITASGSLWLAMAAVGVHMVAMLATTAVLAGSARRGMRAVCLWLQSRG